MGHLSATVKRATICVILLAALASCGLPRSGPTRGELLSASDGAVVPTYVVPVNEFVAQVMPPERNAVFSSEFVKAGVLAPGLIRSGDTLSFTVFENVDEGLFSQGAGASSIGALQVDDEGFVFVPYVGRIRAVGNSPERLRQIITQRLAGLTPEPQVVVQRAAGDVGTVSIEGTGIATQGTFPLQRSNLRLAGMLATAGGVTGEPESVNVIVIRGNHRTEMSYEDFYDDPRFNIALRPGDRIIVERDALEFISLGATGAQGIVPFGQVDLSALEAVARVGGLNESRADPTGVFVLRNESPEVANRVLGRTDFQTEQRLIYVIDLTEPSSLFLAREFIIRNEDTLYVTEAPFTQWTKVLNAIIGTAGRVNSVENIVTN